MKKNTGCYAKIIKYSRKTLKINFNDESLQDPLKYKSYSPPNFLKAVLSGLLLGKQSARELTKHFADISGKLACSSSRCRVTIGNILDEQRVAQYLSTKLMELFLVSKQNLRILKGATPHHLIAGLLDGIDLGQVPKGHKPCAFCLKRKQKDGKVKYFHRVVVLSVMSEYGPLPLFFRFCRQAELTVSHDEPSEEKFKSDCELGCAKELLVEIASCFKGALPFDVVASDALMANAPFMQLVEALGSAGIFIFKQENRVLYQQALADFQGKTFAFNINKTSWDDDPSSKGRTFVSQWGTYVDNNRKGENKNVKIFHTKRIEADGSEVEGMAITSDRSFIGPQLVEEMRFGKWHDLENGVFNALTNQWNTLKHIFFHKSNAMHSMLALQFIALIVSSCYRFGNLRRGERSFSGTLRDFFAHLSAKFHVLRSKTIIDLYYNTS